ncbi:TniQ family protein [Streptomyces atratus]|uniref:TniQ family protein n=1 Tax=Streptomyces atratus TaxID=1893 RepID=UPI002AC31DA9|nr:TniQ family protein [Streptomyces atratus]WPW26345.1 TniQ family protein [Streptomyces atratus]
MREPRTLAIRVIPHPGESLDSWLEALARRSWTPLSALLDALGLPTQERTHSLIVNLSPQMFQQLNKQLNLPAEALDHSSVPAALFRRRAPHWRFCPQCLTEEQGRFPTRWWLPWTFACTKHQVLLHSHCPGCRTEPRVFLPKPVHLHPPGHCMRPSGYRTVCGTGLGDLSALSLPPRHPLLRAQTQLDSLPIHRRVDPRRTFAEADKYLSPLVESLTASDLLALSDASRDAWQKALADLTDPTSGLGGWRLQERRRTVLTPDFLQREYTEGRTPLREIADTQGLPRRDVVRHARDLGVTVFRGNRPHVFDDDWLREQYVARKRTGADIAQETGSNLESVRRRLEHLGIPRRPSGRSMPALITKIEASVPIDIRAAAEETLHGWRRLRRFQISIFFPTLKTSATYLGLLPSTLTLQLDQLECAVGAELFHRSVRHTPQKPTRRGARLLKDLNRDDVQKLMHDALGSKIEAIPDQDTVDAAVAVVDGERSALTSLHDHFQFGERIHIPPPVLPLLEHLLAHAGRETYAGQIQIATGIPFTTVYKQLKRLEAAGWLTGVSP